MSEITSVALKEENNNVVQFKSKQSGDFSFKVDTNKESTMPFIIIFTRANGDEYNLRLSNSNFEKFIHTLIAMKDYKNSF